MMRAPRTIRAWAQIIALAALLFAIGRQFLPGPPPAPRGGLSRMQILLLLRPDGSAIVSDGDGSKPYGVANFRAAFLSGMRSRERWGTVITGYGR